MTLPAMYRWLETVGTLPKTIYEALKFYGIKEQQGAGNNPVIMQWVGELKTAGVSIVGYSADSIPWCGLFAAVVVLRAGKQPVPAPLWAANWRHFGVEAVNPSLGDVLVFQRPGGGHVGFYIAEDKDCFHVLGGNQGDAVSIVRIQRSRCVAMRTPAYTVRPATAVPYRMTATGAVSVNES